jgi:hypothetical protein
VVRFLEFCLVVVATEVGSELRHEYPKWNPYEHAPTMAAAGIAGAAIAAWVAVRIVRFIVVS